MIFFKTLFSFFQDKHYRDLLLTTLIILGIGSVVYHYLEDWSWLDAVYFSIITLTTIGYGDFSPVTKVWTGLEPATPCVTGRYSNQLNYQTVAFY